MSDAGPWANRFDTDLNDEALRRALKVDVTPVQNLAGLPAEQAAAHLRHELKKVFIPTSQMVAVIRRLIEVARSYCEIAYPDSRSVLQRIYSPEEQPHCDDGPAICLTGLAGTGKSALLSAFARIHSEPKDVEVPHHSRLDLRACWKLHMRNRVNLGDLVLPQFRAVPDAIKARYIPTRAAGEAAAQGVAIILGDEFQFVTQSAANVMAAKLLLQLSQIGPPLIYACNFSLVHRLWQRPQQERDRLLANPIVLQPEPLGDDWAATLSELLLVAPEFSALDAMADGVTLHRYCYGIKRALRALLILAYIQMRQQKQHLVTAAHIQGAYASPAFASMRDDIEQLAAGAINPSRLKEHLRCPFGKSFSSSLGGFLSQHPAVEEHADRVAQAALESLVPPTARETLGALSTQVPSERKKRAASIRPPATVQNLIGGAERFARGDENERSK